MPTGYVKKLALKHGVSSSTAEKHWSAAKAAAKKEGHSEDYAYVTSIFKNMMHENAFIPSLKDLTNGMTFKYFLVAEAEAEAPTKERSPIYKHLADRFPQFNELSFKARREIEKEVNHDDLLSDYDMRSQEEKDGIDDHLHDLVIDKMQDELGQGHNFRDWNKEDAEYAARKAEFDRQQADVNDASAEFDPNRANDIGTNQIIPMKRKEREPSHRAAMRQQNIPTDRAAFAPAGSDEIGGPVKSYYKPWSALSPEQRAGRSVLAKKHGTLYRVKNAGWFRQMSPEQQQTIVSVLKSGGSVADARQAAMPQA